MSMATRRLLIISRRRSAAAGFVLRDEFPADGALPAGTRIAQPGPGSLTITGSNWSVSGLTARYNGTTTAGDRIVSELVTRKAGRALIHGWKNRTAVTSGTVRSGWVDSVTDVSAINYGMYFGAGGTTFRIRGVGGDVDSGISSGATGETWFGFIFLNTGALFMVRDGALGQPWRLMYIYRNLSTNMYAKAWMASNAQVIDAGLDAFRIYDLKAPYDTDYGLAEVYYANPPSGQTFTLSANHVGEYSWTPQAGETLEINFRMTDANNRWILRCNQAGGTIQIVERNAGTETVRGTGTPTWPVGTSKRIVWGTDGAGIRVYVADAVMGVYSSAAFNQTATGGSITGQTVGGPLAICPKYITIPAEAG